MPLTVRTMAEVRGDDLEALCAGIDAATEAAFGGTWGAGSRPDEIRTALVRAAGRARNPPDDLRGHPVRRGDHGDESLLTSGVEDLADAGASGVVEY